MLTIVRDREEKDFSRHSVTRVVSFQQEVFLFLPSIKSVKRGIRRGRAAPTPDCKVFLRGGFNVPLDLRDIGTPSWAYWCIELRDSILDFGRSGSCEEVLSCDWSTSCCFFRISSGLRLCLVGIRLRVSLIAVGLPVLHRGEEDLISGATRFAREVVVHSELLKFVVRNLNRP